MSLVRSIYRVYIFLLFFLALSCAQTSHKKDPSNQQVLSSSAAGYESITSDVKKAFKSYADTAKPSASNQLFLETAKDMSKQSDETMAAYLKDNRLDGISDTIAADLMMSQSSDEESSNKEPASKLSVSYTGLAFTGGLIFFTGSSLAYFGGWKEMHSVPLQEALPDGRSLEIEFRQKYWTKLAQFERELNKVIFLGGSSIRDDYVFPTLGEYQESLKNSQGEISEKKNKLAAAYNEFRKRFGIKQNENLAQLRARLGAEPDPIDAKVEGGNAFKIRSDDERGFLEVIREVQMDETNRVRVGNVLKFKAENDLTAMQKISLKFLKIQPGSEYHASIHNAMRLLYIADSETISSLEGAKESHKVIERNKANLDSQPKRIEAGQRNLVLGVIGALAGGALTGFAVDKILSKGLKDDKLADDDEDSLDLVSDASPETVLMKRLQELETKLWKLRFSDAM